MERKELSPIVQRALREIRALRMLPETGSTIAAERKILNRLNTVETLAVALELAKDEEETSRG